MTNRQWRTGLKYFFFLAGFFVTARAFAAEQITLTTYYPAPYGVYRLVQWSTQTTAPPCDATQKGVTFYGTISPGSLPETLWLCGYTYDDTNSWNYDWIPLGAPSSPALEVGGYEMTTTSPLSYYINSGAADWDRMPSTSGTVIWIQETGYSAAVPWGSPSGTVGIVQVNFKGLGKGLYSFEWQCNLDVDQYAGATLKNASVRLANTGSAGGTNSVLDQSQNYQDTNVPGAGNAGFSADPASQGDCGSTNPATTTCTSYYIDRTVTLNYTSASSTKNLYRYYAIEVYKQAGATIMAARVRNAKLIITRME